MYADKRRSVQVSIGVYLRTSAVPSDSGGVANVTSNGGDDNCGDLGGCRTDFGAARNAADRVSGKLCAVPPRCLFLACALQSERHCRYGFELRFLFPLPGYPLMDRS